jgi:aerobic-type carbon monoxide dehydrogenase small subunit (CoxS/CutS family)
VSHEELTLQINGQTRTGVFPRGTRLLDALRRLGYTGTKEGCGEGECGACTVLLDGRTVNSCLIYAKQATGRALVTVEGVGAPYPDGLHPFQKAMIETGGVQCGFCTPGMIVSGCDWLDKRGSLEDADIREALSGNLCRCTGYSKILDAVRLAASRRKPDPG